VSTTTFNPQPCPCGCKKWIMAPWFGCQCSSVSTEEKDELMDIVRDAMRYRALRRVKTSVHPLNPSSYVEQSSLDCCADILIVTMKENGDAP
jgi:hypothetical protein